MQRLDNGFVQGTHKGVTLRAEMVERAIVTAEGLADELDKAIELATRKNQCRVVVTAIMGKAKLFGLLNHKKESRTGYLDNLGPDQLKLIHDLVAEVIASSEQPPPADPDENVHQPNSSRPND